VEKSYTADWTLTNGKAVNIQAYEILRVQIIQGVLTPGTIISETEVSRNLQISRQPVREAFIKLHNEGLVEVRPQRGTLVTHISIEAVSDARFIREAVEADIVKLLVEKNTPEMIQTLRNLIKHQRIIEDDQLETFINLDDQFHRTLAVLAEKGNTWKITVSTKAHFDRVRYLSSIEKALQPLVDQHEAVVDAIEQRDSAKAESAIRFHLREVLRDLPVLVSQQPEIFTGDGEHS
jgi:DNA-binding GntR family transcriptional regulator